MDSQVLASRPTATREVSARLTRWVTSRQKSYAEPVTVCAASSGPQAHRSPDGAVSVDPELLGRGVEAVGREREVAGADPEVRDVADPVAHLGLGAERRVHVEGVRPGLHEAGGAPSRSADIGGPYHGIRWPSG